MKYVCLIYDEEKKKSAMSKAESDALVGAYFAFSEGIRKARACDFLAASEPSSTGLALRRKS